MEETKKENIWLEGVLYPFRLIASFASALSMDDKGFSLKKILATFATYKASRYCDAQLAPNNILIILLIWLVFAGILIGLYSLSDVSNALGRIKGNNTSKDDSNNTSS